MERPDQAISTVSAIGEAAGGDAHGDGTSGREHTPREEDTIEPCGREFGQ